MPEATPTGHPMTMPDLNVALAEYLCATLPKDEALGHWLVQHCPPAQRKQARQQVTDVVDEATTVIENGPGGMHFTPEFWQRLRQHLTLKHPWVTVASVQGMRATSAGTAGTKACTRLTRRERKTHAPAHPSFPLIASADFTGAQS